MGNNNATANLTEEESSKLDTNGMSPLESVPVETTQDQVFLAVEGKDGDKQKESFSDCVIGEETQETESESKEVVEDPKVKVEEKMGQNGLESLVMETDEQLEKNTSFTEGVETVWEATEVDELTMVGTQSVVSNLNTKETGNEEKPCVRDEIVFVSPSSNETAGTEENMVNDSLEETAPAGKVLKLDQEEICMELRTGFSETERQEILNLDNVVLDDDDEVTHEGKADQEISKPGSQGPSSILETGFEVYKEERDMKLGREARLKRMSRCRSVPVRQNSRVLGDSLVQKLVSEVTFSSRNNVGVDKANTSEILLVSCLKSNKEQATTEAITESSNAARLDVRSPSFSNVLRIEERSDKSMEKAPLFPQGKTKTDEVTLEAEEKTVMLKRSETEKTRGFELSMNLSGRCDADDIIEETKGSRDKLMDRKANASETLLVACVRSSEAQETAEVIIESNKISSVEMRSPSFGNDLRIKERSDESTEKIPLPCLDKIETYKATIDVEKNVMLKRSETEKIRGFELSLGLSMNLSGRCDADDSLKETKGSGDNLVDKKANTFETLLVSCVGSSEAQGTNEVINESNKKAQAEMRSPSFGNDLRIKERSDESAEEIPLLCQDKIETYEAATDAEKKTVMLKRSKSEKTRGFELSLGLSMNLSGRPDAGDSLKEAKDSGDNLLDKKASWGPMRGRVRKRSKSSLFGTCLCCATAMN